uniref:Alternative protein MEF2A n=1 Tax=Homo sapiens TaxID=9606 RepID=L0R504_HUMAN|nr:alternative protein MEF2A [Homo sapiens]
MYVGVSVYVWVCVTYTESGTYLQTPCRSADVCPMADKAPCRHRQVWHFLGLLVS